MLGNGEGGFDLARFCKLMSDVYIYLKSKDDMNLDRLDDVLFHDGFLLSRDMT